MAINQYQENGKRLYEVYVNGVDARGRRFQRRKKGIESLPKAKAVEFELKRTLAQKKEERIPYRWHEWFDECLKRMRLEYLPSTVAGYDSQVRKWINPHWNDIEIQEITKTDVYNLIFRDCGIQTQYTRRNVLKMTKRLFQMAVEEGILERNPCLGVNVRVTEVDQKVLTAAEAEKFLREACEANHRFYPVWVLALLTGLRSGELMGLRWSDVDFDAKAISVSRQWTSKTGFTPTKTRRNRIVPISEDLLAFLKGWKLGADPAREFVLPHLEEWKHGEQARVTRDFCAAIGITSVKFHDLRATFITNLLARGESLARVMAMVGHTELKTTNTYLRKAGVDVQGGTEKLGYRLPQGVEGAVLPLFQRKS